MESLAKALLLLSGGALAISIYVFVGSGAPELLAGEIRFLRVAWWLLFYSLTASAGVLVVGLFLESTRWVERALGISGFLALVIGLALLVAVSASVVGADTEGYESAAAMIWPP